MKNINVSRIFGELLGVVISLVVVIYLLPQTTFVTDAYWQWLPISVVATLIGAVIKFAKIAIFPKFEHNFTALRLLPDMVSTFMLAWIFPLTFTFISIPNIDQLIRVALYVSVFGMAVAMIVHIVRFAKNNTV